jgi:iduronate 2-sulfatase
VPAAAGRPNPAGKQAARKQSPQDRAAMFAKRDANQDGKLTREEFLANQPDPEQAAQRWTNFDTDKNGELSREEFITSGGKVQPGP